MSAEIFILSGARAGERIILDTTEFRVGSAANCEVFFDPKQDLPAKGRSALFRLMDDGWIVSCTGVGELFINQEVVSGRTRIRSGDVLRMSSDGPAFSFSILSRAAAAAAAGRTPANMPPFSIPARAAAAAATAPPARMLDPQPASRASPPLRVPATAPVPALPMPAARTAAPVPAADPSPSSAPAPAVAVSVPTAAQPSNVSTGKIRPIFWAGAIGGGLAIIALVVCVAIYVMTPPPPLPQPITPPNPHKIPARIHPSKPHELPKVSP